MVPPSVAGRAASVASDTALRWAVPQSVPGGRRVVLFTSSDCWRGAGVSFIEIASGLEGAGLEPRIVATDPVVASEFASAGFPVTMTQGGRGESARLRRYLRAHSVNVVLVDRAHDLRVATLSTLGTRIPVIFRYNHFRETAPSDGLIRVAYRTTLKEQVFLSRLARERVLRDTPFMRGVPATTIHEGIDAADFRPNRRAAAEFRRTMNLGSAPFFLAVGALSPEKRYEVLFDALRLMQVRGAAPKLIICGEGPQEQELRNRAEQLGIDARFVGRVPRAWLVGAYGACTGLVHAGSVETFGLAVLEAMSCGRPVIASAGGALPEVVGRDGSCGMLVSPNSALDLACAMERLLANPELGSRMGERARERARVHFSIGAMRRAYVHVVARQLGYRLVRSG